MKLGVADVIALVKAGYKMQDIKALLEQQEEKPEEKPAEKPEEKPEDKPTVEKSVENPEEKPEEKSEDKPTVEDLKNQIRDLTSQIKAMQENNKEVDVSNHTDTTKTTDNDLMLDLFRTFM